jgi:hypothetical protein
MTAVKADAKTEPIRGTSIGNFRPKTSLHDPIQKKKKIKTWNSEEKIQAKIKQIHFENSYRQAVKIQLEKWCRLLSGTVDNGHFLSPPSLLPLCTVHPRYGHRLQQKNCRKLDRPGGESEKRSLF